MRSDGEIEKAGTMVTMNGLSRYDEGSAISVR